MDRLEQMIAVAGEHIADGWSPARTEASLHHFRRRQKSRHIWRVAAASAAVGFVAGVIAFKSHTSQTTTPLPESPVVELRSDEPGRKRFEVQSGAAWFRVEPSEERVVEVDIDEAQVLISGTELVLERDEKSFTVWVRTGSATVKLGGKRYAVSAGESRFFSLHPDRPVAPAEPPVGPAEPVPAEPEPAPAPAPPDRPSDQEDRRLRDQSRSQLGATGKDGFDRVGNLLGRADWARRRGDIATAERSLRSIADDHPRDPRASAALFSLGRLLADEKGDHISAARTFARIRRIDPSGPLAEPALAREVEAWARAGRQETARSRAREYMKRFPDGHQRGAVKRWGQL